MTFTHCPTCKQQLHPWIGCSVCINPHCFDAAEYPRVSPAPAQQSPGESVAAPAEVGQGLGTITCAACGSTNTEPCCHPAEFCQAICNDCNKPLNADGSVWVESTSLPVEVPESETLWLFLTKGYSLNYIRESLVCGIPHLEAEARMLRDRAHKNWAQIRAEVGV